MLSQNSQLKDETFPQKKQLPKLLIPSDDDMLVSSSSFLGDIATLTILDH